MSKSKVKKDTVKVSGEQAKEDDKKDTVTVNLGSAQIREYLLLGVIIILSSIVVYQQIMGTGCGGKAIFNQVPVVASGDLVGENAVKILEFSDFKCPYCSRAAATVGEIKKIYGDKIDLEYRQFPLDFHKGSDLASEAAECARDQEKFWQYHDLLFSYFDKGQDVGQRANLDKIAQETALDAAKFKQCLDSGVKKAIVARDKAQGASFGITGTPTFVIDGDIIKGAQPIEKFKEVIDEKLAQKK